MLPDDSAIFVLNVLDGRYELAVLARDNSYLSDRSTYMSKKSDSSDCECK